MQFIEDMKKVTLAALAAAMLAAAMLAAAADAPPQAGSRMSPDAPPPAHKRGVYGAPIQPAIVGHRRTSHHKASPKKAPKRKRKSP